MFSTSNIKKFFFKKFTTYIGQSFSITEEFRKQEIRKEANPRGEREKRRGAEHREINRSGRPSSAEKLGSGGFVSRRSGQPTRQVHALATVNESVSESNSCSIATLLQDPLYIILKRFALHRQIDP